jgi:hypothetical protein
MRNKAQPQLPLLLVIFGYRSFYSSLSDLLSIPNYLQLMDEPKKPSLTSSPASLTWDLSSIQPLPSTYKPPQNSHPELYALDHSMAEIDRNLNFTLKSIDLED